MRLLRIVTARIATARIAAGWLVAGRLVAAAVTGAALLAATAGCQLAAQRRLDFSDTEQVRITRITVFPGSGDVNVRTAQVSAVEIHRLVRYRGAEPDTGYRIEGSELFLDTDCGRRCEISYDIVAPEGVTVRGENGSGDAVFTRVGGLDYTVGSGSIEVTDATGEVTAASGSGDITVTRSTGAVTLRTGSGAVTGRGLAGGEVRAETGSGSLDLTLTRPGSVRVEAGSGDVRLAVPTGSYQVRASTESGDTDIRIAHDPSAAAAIIVHTGSGDVVIDRTP